MLVRIVLKAKKDIIASTFKKGDLCIIYNDIFNERNGVAFYPIEKENWEVVGSDLWTGKFDKHGALVYINDIVEFDRDEWGSDNNIHLVSWDKDEASISFGGGTVNDMEYRTVIGNVYENPELLAN